MRGRGCHPRRRATGRVLKRASSRYGAPGWGLSPWLVLGQPLHPADRLVMYVFSDSDPEYMRNLEFFVAYGMAEGDGCDYIVVVQEVLSGPSLPFGPALDDAPVASCSKSRPLLLVLLGCGCGTEHALTTRMSFYLERPLPLVYVNFALAWAGMADAKLHAWVCTRKSGASSRMDCAKAVAGRGTHRSTMHQIVCLAMQDAKGQLSGALPDLPSNGRYEYHGNS